MQTRTAKNGKLFRLSGIENRNGTWIATIFWLESEKYEEFNYNLIEKYL